MTVNNNNNNNIEVVTQRISSWIDNDISVNNDNEHKQSQPTITPSYSRKRTKQTELFDCLNDPVIMANKIPHTVVDDIQEYNDNVDNNNNNTTKSNTRKGRKRKPDNDNNNDNNTTTHKTGKVKITDTGYIEQQYKQLQSEINKATTASEQLKLITQAIPSNTTTTTQPTKGDIRSFFNKTQNNNDVISNITQQATTHVDNCNNSDNAQQPNITQTQLTQIIDKQININNQHNTVLLTRNDSVQSTATHTTQQSDFNVPSSADTIHHVKTRRRTNNDNHDNSGQRQSHRRVSKPNNNNNNNSKQYINNSNSKSLQTQSIIHHEQSHTIIQQNIDDINNTKIIEPQQFAFVTPQSRHNNVKRAPIEVDLSSLARTLKTQNSPIPINNEFLNRTFTTQSATSTNNKSSDKTNNTTQQHNKLAATDVHNNNAVDISNVTDATTSNAQPTKPHRNKRKNKSNNQSNTEQSQTIATKSEKITPTTNINDNRSPTLNNKSDKNNNSQPAQQPTAAAAATATTTKTDDIADIAIDNINTVIDNINNAATIATEPVNNNTTTNQQSHSSTTEPTTTQSTPTTVHITATRKKNVRDNGHNNQQHQANTTSTDKLNDTHHHQNKLHNNNIQPSATITETASRPSTGNISTAITIPPVKRKSERVNGNGNNNSHSNNNNSNIRSVKGKTYQHKSMFSLTLTKPTYNHPIHTEIVINNDTTASTLPLLTASVSTSTGQREKSQDDYALQIDADLLIGLIADGHGALGHNSSMIVKSILPNMIATHHTKHKNIINTIQHCIEYVHNLLIRIATNEMTYFAQHVTQPINEHIKSLYDYGTTLTMCILQQRTLYIANVGDSRLVLYQRTSPTSKWQICFLTTDHTTDDDKEIERVKQAGAVVLQRANERRLTRTDWQSKHIGCSVNMTRAIGHAMLSQVGLTSQPDITTLQINSSCEHVVIIGSDGLFDVIDNDKIIEQLNTQAIDSSKVSNTLVELADSKWKQKLGGDNITVLCVYIPADKDNNMTV